MEDALIRRIALATIALAVLGLLGFFLLAWRPAIAPIEPPKLTLIIDAGTIFHPNSAEAQVEGAALWGLSMAMHEGSEFVKGQPNDINLDTYTPLRMGDVPKLEIEFLPSTEAPVGLGEPAKTAVAPAIANAIFAASGARVRHLSIRPEAVRQALAHQT
jgi:CO/xanthine dehydrogenase Mo-binding subunit